MALFEGTLERHSFYYVSEHGHRVCGLSVIQYLLFWTGVWWQARMCVMKRYEIILYGRDLFGPSYDLSLRSSSTSSTSSPHHQRPLPFSSFFCPYPLYSSFTLSHPAFQDDRNTHSTLPLVVLARLLSIPQLNTLPFPPFSNRQRPPLLSSVRINSPLWHSIRLLQPLLPPPALRHRFPSVKHPPAPHPPLFLSALP
jgi:hypothetical protein